MKGLPRLLIYARTSTDDQQSPEDSLAWQVSLANALVAGRAEIIAVVHETDTSSVRHERPGQVIIVQERRSQPFEESVAAEDLNLHSGRYAPSVWCRCIRPEPVFWSRRPLLCDVPYGLVMGRV